MSVKKLNEVGLKRANPCACPTNALVLKECNPCPDPVCQDVITIPDAVGKTIVAYTLGDEKHTIYLAPGFAKPLVSSNASDLDDTFEKGFALVSNHEIDPFFDVKKDGTSTVITHIGQCRLKSITLSDGTVIEAVTLCSIACFCPYQVTIPGSKKPKLVVTDNEGTEVVSADLPNDYSTVDADTATQLETDLNAAWSDGTFTVTINSAIPAYVVSVETEGEYSLVLSEKDFVLCGDCVERFVESK